MAGRAATWSSDDASIVTVNEVGRATAHATGSAVVTASIDGVSASATLSVQRWTTVAAGGSHTCALASTGRAYCWGSGIGVPRALAVEVRFSSLSVGSVHSCGVTIDQAAYCWGDNTWGQLGDGSLSASTVPVRVAGGLKFSQVAAMTPVGTTGAHTCGVSTDDAAYCWGWAEQGQLGAGVQTSGLERCGTAERPRMCKIVPIAVAGGFKFKSISTGSAHSCGITEAGAAYCWGREGPQGFGNTPALVPGPMPTSVVFASVSGEMEHSCALTPSREAHCWGADVFGKLGYGPGPRRTLVTRVVGDGWAQVTVGPQHTCGLKTDGAAYCWGKNNLEGSVGDGTYVSRDVPTAVTGGLTFTAIAAGSHSCGVTTNGAIYCWGPNGSGQLGDGAFVMSPVPVRVANP